MKVDVPRGREVGAMKPEWSNKGQKELVGGPGMDLETFCRNPSCLPKGLALPVGEAMWAA